jgi:hypothetical protein
VALERLPFAEAQRVNRCNGGFLRFGATHRMVAAIEIQGISMNFAISAGQLPELVDGQQHLRFSLVSVALLVSIRGTIHLENDDR